MDFTQLFLIGFIICTIIQLGFWWGLFSRLAFFKTPVKSGISEDEHDEKRDIPVSIIICARNEAANLAKFLTRILSQNYHLYEVIVVNDNSTDTTEDILIQHTINCPYLRIIHIHNKYEYDSQVGKKRVLAEGINSARHNVLLLTDADCEVASENWLREMQGSLQGDKQIVLGFSPYFRYPGCLNLFIRYETIYTAVQYFSFALAKMPYMGVGRNLAYHKRLFELAGGFKKHEHIASGDDDLFINQVSTPQNVNINIDPDTFVFSEPKRSWKAYFGQKARHMTTGREYQTKHKILLGLLSTSHFGHYFFGGLLLMAQGSANVVIILYTIRMLSMIILYGKILKKLRDPSMLVWIPILDAAFVLFYVVFAPFLMTGKRNQWT